MNIHRTFLVLILGLLLSGTTHIPAKAAAQEQEYVFWSMLAKRAATEAHNMLGHTPDPQAALVLTNAGYVVIGGHTTEACLDGVPEWKGATPGKGTVLEVHSARKASLWFFFYEMSSGDGVYCEVNDSELSKILANLPDMPPEKIRSQVTALSADKLFVRLVKENIEAEKLLANPDAWNAKVAAQVFDGREFAIVTIANGVAHGAPYDLLKGVLFHDHYCPGVTAGYLLVNYLDKFFPLESSSDRYFVLSIPPWCKDDAVQTLLNTTPGKAGCSVIYLNNDQKANLKDEAKNIAGIFFRYRSDKGTWDGRVLSFNFGKVQKLSGIDFKSGYPWESRLKSDLWLLDRLDQPELFVETILEFNLEKGEEPKDWAVPGVNPLQKLNLLKPS